MKMQTPFPLSRTFLCTIILATVFFTSCKKNNDEGAKVVEQIQRILPQKYIDSLQAHGFTLHEGKTPPTLNGIYLFKPISDYDNSGYFYPGKSALDMKIYVANQSGTDADVYIKGFISLSTTDTSSAQVIAGNGNDFTIYAQAKGGIPVYTYDYIFTGTYTAAGLQNLKFAFIMIDNGGNNSAAATETIRIFHDNHMNSEVITTFRSAFSPGDIGTAVGAAK